MRPESLAVGLSVMVVMVASVSLHHEAGYQKAGLAIMLASLLAGSLITVLGRARPN